MTYTLRPTVLVVLAFVVAPVAARANLRAPHLVRAAPSGALRPSGAPDLTALSEELSFDCTAGTCRVRAEYRITAKAPNRYAFTFLLPAQEPVTARVTPAQSLAVTGVAKPTATAPKEYCDPSAPPCFEASFEAPLVAGENRIIVEYAQKLAAIEHDYGYFRPKGRMLPHFDYLLGPLKEWTLHDKFAIHVRVSTTRQPVSWWQRTFGKYLEIACTGESDGRTLAGRRTQEGSRYHHDLAFDNTSFPGRLTCYLGDDDLVPRTAQNENR